MDVNNIASVASSLSKSSLDESVGMTVLKKALDSSSEMASALINAIPAVSAPNLPSHLGQNINTTA